MEKFTGKKEDILQRSSLKENPYTLPDDYFAMVEDNIQKKIHGSDEAAEERGLIPVLRTAIMLACTFAIILGFGYGIMYVTEHVTAGDSQNIVALEQSEEIENDSLDQEQIFDTIGSQAILETISNNYYADAEEGGQTIDGNITVDKDNIEQYLIESNISLITLASLE